MRKIIHIDMDCFFAAVEMRDDPSLKNIPIAIAGRSERSVVSTCNYLAREYGVRSAMSVIKAMQLCPHLTLVPGRMDAYKEASVKIREIFSRYTDLIEPLSLDEAYLDVTNCTLHQGSATLIAKQIRQQIQDELNLTASAGVAPNKFIAKIASDENKPNGQCVVAPDKIDEFVKELDLKKIPGVGPKTLARLQQRGFYTCADVRKSNVAALTVFLGKFGAVIFERAHGIDNRQVQPSRERKSLAIETTLMSDLNNLDECIIVLDRLIEKFLIRLEKVEKLSITRQGVKLKFSDFTQTTVEQSNKGVNLDLYKPLLEQAFSRGGGKSVRLIGISVGFAKPLKEPIKKPQLTLPF